MTWVKLADTFPDHPKVLEVGDQAAWLYVASLCFCSRHLTDGHIPAGAVSRLTGLARPNRLASRLVEVGLWVECADGYRVHDYMSHQRSRATVDGIRDAARERQRRHRADENVSRRDKGVSHDEVTRPETETETETETERDGAPTKSRRKPMVPCPEPFVVTDDMRAWVAREHPALDWDMATREFVSWAKAADKRYANWEQGWRNGMGRAARWHKPEAARTHL